MFAAFLHDHFARVRSAPWFLLIFGSAVLAGTIGLVVYVRECRRICGPVIHDFITFVPRQGEAVLYASGVLGIVMGGLVALGASVVVWPYLRQRWRLMGVLAFPLWFFLIAVLVMNIGVHRTDAVDPLGDVMLLGCASLTMVLVSGSFGVLFADVSQPSTTRHRTVVWRQAQIWMTGAVILATAGYLGTDWSLVLGWLLCWWVIGWRMQVAWQSVRHHDFSR